MRKMSKFVRIVVTLILALSMVLGSYVGVFAAVSPSIDESSVEILIGKTEKLNTSNANGWNVTYTTSDSSVATVNANGRIRGVSDGIATITIKFKKTGKADVYDYCTVNVYNEPSITSSYQMFKGDSAQLDVINGDGWSVVWSTSQAGKVSVSQTGLITGLKATNNTVVKATFKRGSKTVVKNCDVEVLELEINKSSIQMYVGEVEQLDISNDSTWTTVWSTADSSIASVDESGNVTGLYPGNVTVTATSTKEGKSPVINTCLVSVELRSSYQHVDTSKSGIINYIIQRNGVEQSSTPLLSNVSDLVVSINGVPYDNFSFGDEYRTINHFQFFIIDFWWPLDIDVDDTISISANLNTVVDGESIVVPYNKTFTRDELISSILLCPSHRGFDFLLSGEYVVNTNYYSVDFLDVDSVSLGGYVDVESGMNVGSGVGSVPSDPTRAENNDGLGTRTTYEFLGWDDGDTLDVELYSAAEVASVIVTSDKTFNAVYDATNYYMMYFYSEDGGTLLAQIEIKEGDPMVYPNEVPEKEDEVRADGKYYFTFAGWFPFEITYLTSVAPVVEGVSGSETLKAVFVENKYITVNFYAQLPNGTRVLVETQYLLPGEDAVDPSADWMTNNNYILGDWNGDLTGIEEDTDLTARAANVAGAVETNTDTNTDRQPVVAGATEVQTGDNTPVVSMSLLLIAAAFSIVFIVSRRRKNA